jgi:hypothetical protein
MPDVVGRRGQAGIDSLRDDRTNDRVKLAWRETFAVPTTTTSAGESSPFCPYWGL